MMREMAIHTVFTVSSEIVNAGILETFNMQFIILAFMARSSWAFINSKVLLSAESLNSIQFTLQFFKLYEVFVVHFVLSTIVII
jgi:hypothetical protein